MCSRRQVKWAWTSVWRDAACYRDILEPESARSMECRVDVHLGMTMFEGVCAPTVARDDHPAL